VAPDGRSLAFIGRTTENDSAPPLLYVRHFDRLNAEPMPGTEGAVAPFYSADGQWIGFFAGGVLKKVPIGGGPAIAITSAPIQRGAWWSADDTIVFGSAEGLTRVRASGGTPEVILRSTPGQPPPSTPQVLPDGRAVLFTEFAGSDPNSNSIKLVELPGGAVKTIVAAARAPRYVSSGHLTFTRQGTMFAVPFDLQKLEPVGEAVPVIEGISTAVIGGAALAGVSSSGIAAYVPGPLGDSRQAPLMSLTKTGGLMPLRATPSIWSFPRFAPDGHRVAMTIFDGRQNDIWVYDIPRDILTRVTADPANDLDPIFTPDGLGIVFASTRDGSAANLYWQRADGTGSAVRLTEGPVAKLPDSISPDGKRIVLHQGDPTTTRQSLAIVPIESAPGEPIKAGAVKEFLGGPFLKANARVSPDGKWVAYSTNESGTFEIYVQPFPDGGARVQVSANGGNLAVWSPTKHEIYFAAGGLSRMMAVPYAITNGVFVPEKPQPWSQVAFSAAPPLGTYGPSFDIHPGGESFAVAGAPAGAGAGRNSQVVLFFNFFDELRRVAPVK
jgi:serine/threonine-protein kinase